MNTYSGTYLIAIKPNLSKSLQEWIRKNIAPSMQDMEGVKHYYELYVVMEVMEDNSVGKEEDYKLIQEMYEDGVGYIEI